MWMIFAAWEHRRWINNRMVTRNEHSYTSIPHCRWEGQPTEQESILATGVSTEEVFDLLKDTLSDLGFVPAHDKCIAPTTALTFLGIRLDTDTDGEGLCSAAVDHTRRSRIAEACLQITEKGHATIKELQSILGKLSFAAQVVDMSRGFLRAGFTALKGALRRKAPKSTKVKLSPQVLMDLRWWRACMRGAAPRVMLTRRAVLTAFASTDASLTGMGGYYNGRHFSFTWRQMAESADTRPFYPTVRADGRAVQHINFLELFCVYYWVRLYGRSCSGCTVVIHVDNTAAMGMIEHMCGPMEYMAILRPLRQMLIRFDLRLRPVYITSKDNAISDALSRQDMPAFYNACQTLISGINFTRDEEDYQLRPHIICELDNECGPFCTEGAMDIVGANAYFAQGWNSRQDCRTTDWRYRNVFMNGPFSMMEAIIKRFLVGKRTSPVGTGALFIVPAWRDAAFYQLILNNSDIFSTTPVRRWPAGTSLFTYPRPPHEGSGRVDAGPTRWEVEAWWAPPAAP